ncbi:hypothetical protein GCM10027406_07810 [Leifsonia lichenia]
MTQTAYARWSALDGAELVAADALGTRYRIHLAEVGPLSVSGEWASFVLRFRAGLDLPAEQNTYEIIGDGIAEPVFLVPVRRDADGLDLEAAFTIGKESE